MAVIPIDEETGGVVRLSTDDGTTWLEIGDLTNVSASHSRDEPTLRKVFGAADPYSKAGDRNDSYSFDGLYSPGDTGQDQAITSLEDGDLVLMEYHPDGAAGKQQEVRITSIDVTGDVEGDFWEVSISATGVGAVTDATVV